MAAAKKTTKKSVKKAAPKAKPTPSKQDIMYISFTDSEEKRKELLHGLKSALILQEEIEQIQELRKAKAQILENIRSTLTSLNNNYQTLKKQMPNIDNILQYTEQELALLEGTSKKRVKSAEPTEVKDEPMPEKKVATKKTTRKKSNNETRLDRIQNNLKVIESRLKSI